MLVTGLQLRTHHPCPFPAPASLPPSCLNCCCRCTPKLNACVELSPPLPSSLPDCPALDLSSLLLNASSKISALKFGSDSALAEVALDPDPESSSLAVAVAREL